MITSFQFIRDIKTRHKPYNPDLSEAIRILASEMQKERFIPTPEYLLSKGFEVKSYSRSLSDDYFCRKGIMEIRYYTYSEMFVITEKMDIEISFGDKEEFEYFLEQLNQQ